MVTSSQLKEYLSEILGHRLLLYNEAASLAKITQRSFEMIDNPGDSRHGRK